MEFDDNEKVHSISLTSERKQNCESVYDLLEKMLAKNNMDKAFKRVKRNKGSHGIDQFTTDELLEHLQVHGVALRRLIPEGSYTPKPVRRVEIPKDNRKKQNRKY